MRRTPIAGRLRNPEHLPQRLTTPDFTIDAARTRHRSRGERRMTVTVTQLHPHIGAEIGGLDLREAVDAATVAALWQAIDTHAVLVFHEQQLSDEQLRTFAARFGELEIGRSAARGGRRRLSFP